MIKTYDKRGIALAIPPLKDKELQRSKFTVPKRLKTGKDMAWS